MLIKLWTTEPTELFMFLPCANIHKVTNYLWKCFCFPFFVVLGFWTQDLTFARQMAYHLSHNPNPMETFSTCSSRLKFRDFKSEREIGVWVWKSCVLKLIEVFIHVFLKSVLKMDQRPKCKTLNSKTTRKKHFKTLVQAIIFLDRIPKAQ
jgi:hypothetical protein